MRRTAICRFTSCTVVRACLYTNLMSLDASPGVTSYGRRVMGTGSSGAIGGSDRTLRNTFFTRSNSSFSCFSPSSPANLLGHPKWWWWWWEEKKTKTGMVSTRAECQRVSERSKEHVESEKEIRGLMHASYVDAPDVHEVNSLLRERVHRR